MFDVNVRHKCMIHDKMSTSVLKRSFFYFSRKKELSFYCQRFELFRDPQSVSVFVKKCLRELRKERKSVLKLNFSYWDSMNADGKQGEGKEDGQKAWFSLVSLFVERVFQMSFSVEPFFGWNWNWKERPDFSELGPGRDNLLLITRGASGIKRRNRPFRGHCHIWWYTTSHF